MSKAKIVPASLLDSSSINVGISKASITYVQNGDCNSDEEENFITIETEDCVETEKEVVENGKDAYYYVIKTDRWSLDNEKELVGLLADFKARIHQTRPLTDGEDTGETEQTE